MITQDVWYSGGDNHRKHTLDVDTDSKINKFYTEILDVECQTGRNIYQITNDMLSVRQTKYVEVLLSGGVDSEFVIHTCLANNIPVRALSMRLLVDGVTINTPDMYYSEKYCRGHKVEQNIVDLDVRKFFENGDHYKYLDPFRIATPHVATQFWVAEQASDFVVYGGDYTWPWVLDGRSIISPPRFVFANYDRFLQSKSIHGIGNFTCHTLEANLLLTKAHVKVMKNFSNFENKGVTFPLFKSQLMREIGYTDVEPRFIRYGWELNDSATFDKDMYRDDLIARYGKCLDFEVSWGHAIADAIGGLPGSNNRIN